MDLVPSPSSKFLKVVCEQCKNEQIIFDKASSVVKCLVCENVLAEPTGGKINIKSKNVKLLS
ncbi:MAG: 30S ribosomal protein S27e [Candidatus Aenigmarchaeota archaeon]|nr:30S ribosomal protein S27e [Candidatus Aenigmarchaeota archaeon]